MKVSVAGFTTTHEACDVNHSLGFLRQFKTRIYIFQEIKFLNITSMNIPLFAGLAARCQYASGSSCDRPSIYTGIFFLVLLRLQANYALLVQPSQLKFIRIKLMLSRGPQSTFPNSMQLFG
jgi:hypothetical protein